MELPTIQEEEIISQYLCRRAKELEGIQDLVGCLQLLPYPKRTSETTSADAQISRRLLERIEQLAKNSNSHDEITYFRWLIPQVGHSVFNKARAVLNQRTRELSVPHWSRPSPRKKEKESVA